MLFLNLTILQELAQEAEYLALWLDCDREGENIGFEVISLCQEWIPYDNVYRAKFSALTAPELVNAYNNLDRSVLNLNVLKWLIALTEHSS